MFLSQWELSTFNLEYIGCGFVSKLGNLLDGRFSIAFFCTTPKWVATLGPPVERLEEVGTRFFFRSLS